jgi:hypothetical protein
MNQNTACEWRTGLIGAMFVGVDVVKVKSSSRILTCFNLWELGSLAKGMWKIEGMNVLVTGHRSV